jgi:hypothetical protein
MYLQKVISKKHLGGKKIIFCLYLEGHLLKDQGTEPLARGKDPDPPIMKQKK